MSEELPQLPFESEAAFGRWLAANHATCPGIWLKLAKKASGIPSVTYAEALEHALIWGWIDSQKKGFDEDWFLQRFTPRRPRSPWSRINRGKAEKLIAAGRMQAPGLAEVEAAEADGRWQRAYAGQRDAKPGADLVAALREAGQEEAFAALTAAQRYSIIWQVDEAKRAETRARRIAKFVAMLASGEKP